MLEDEDRLLPEGLRGDAWKWWRDEMGHGYRLEGLEYGAAVAFGLMGMAEAIRTRPDTSPWPCVDCGKWNLAMLDYCAHCTEPEPFI